MKSRERIAVAAVAALSVYGIGSAAQAATNAYFDDFNRTGLNGGTYTYTTTKVPAAVANPVDSDADVGAVWGGVPYDNVLAMTSDATGAANNSGHIWTSTPTSTYVGFDQTLSENTGNVLTWSLNMQQIRANPSGFGTNNYGAAYVLGATNNIFHGTGAGNGYALVMGNSGAPDPVRLVKFTGGLTSQTVVAAAAGEDVGANFWSIKVEYDPATNNWRLFRRNDGTAFADPTAGSYGSAVTGTDSTHTGVDLTHSGAHWTHANGAGQVAQFDNFRLDLDAPVVTLPPRNLTWDGDGAAGTNPSNVSADWDGTAKWYDGVAHQTWDGTRPDNATFGTGSGTGGTTTVTVAAPQTTGTLTFAANSPAYTLTGQALTVNGNGGVGIVAAQSATINAVVGIGAPQSWDVANGATLTIGDGTNGGLNLSGTITKTGAGEVVFNTPASSFNGGLIINGGKVKVTSVDGSGRSGIGVSNVSIGNGATFHIDGAFTMGNTGTEIALLIDNGGTLLGTGSPVLRANNGPDIPQAAGTIATIATQNAGDVFTINSTVRDVGAGVSGAKIVVNGPGRVILASGAVSANDAFGGTWELQSGILQLGPVLPGGQGEPFNALGFEVYDVDTGVGDGPNGPGRPITVTGGTLAAADNTANTTVTATTFRSPITLAGGALASTQVDATYSGDISFTAASTINTNDPVPDQLGVPRSVVFATQPRVTGSNVVNGNLNWGSANVTVDGAGTLKFQRVLPTVVGTDPASTVSVTPGATLTITSGATVELDGTQDALSDGTDHVNIVNASPLGVKVLNGTKNTGGISGAGSTSVATGATLVAGHVRQNTLTVDGVARVRPDSTAAGTSKLSNLVVNTGGQLDLTNNKLVVSDAAGGWDGDDYTGVIGLVQDGRGDGSWNGSGIMTSQTHADTGLTTLAVVSADNTAYVGGTFGGQSVAAGDTLVMYTYGGDADLNGAIDSDDYFAIDSNFNLSGSVFGYNVGDFDYNGAIDSDDYFIIDSNFNNQILGQFPTSGGSAEGVTAVPEPASLALAGLAATTLLGRRRRNSSR